MRYFDERDTIEPRQQVLKVDGNANNVLLPFNVRARDDQAK